MIMKTKEAQKALEDLMDYFKDHADFAQGEDDHVIASKAICLLAEVRKHMKALPEKQ